MLFTYIGDFKVIVMSLNMLFEMLVTTHITYFHFILHYKNYKRLRER